jgi:hypothetical protein
MRSSTFWRLGLAVLTLAAAALRAAEPAADTYYYDEATMRYLHLKPTGLGSSQVEVRFATDPGASGLWVGMGEQKDKDLIFARVVGEGEDRGTYFIADVSESKVVIRYKPGQLKTEDAGILGIYRRTTDGKRMQLARKEFQSATDRLVASLKNATKAWEAKDRPALALWKDQWPAMRQRWMDVNFSQPTPATDAAAKGAAAKSAVGKPTAAAPAGDKLPEYWIKMAEATSRGYYFVEAMPDPKTGLDWDGEYDDFAGGHASLRLQKDGKLRLSLSFTRAPGETATGTMEVVALPEKVTKSKDGYPMASFTYSFAGVDPEADAETIAKAKAKADANPASVRLTKIGRYLRVETENAGRYAGRGWFDGIYRGAPVPADG